MTDVLAGLTGPDDPELDLVVFPGAGAGPSSIIAWRELVPATWRLSAVCLPGRGTRFGEDAATDPSRIADEVAGALGDPSGRRIVFAGHSIGALWALDTAVRVEPELLVTAACQAPPPNGTVPVYEATEEDDREFIRDLLVALDVTDEDTLDELIEISVPVLRSDIELSEQWVAPAVRLSCPIVSYYGTEDGMPAEAWTAYSDQTDVVKVPGDHYFIQTCADEVVADLVQRLSP